MSLFDFVDIGLVGKKDAVGINGSCSVTIGDALSAYYGPRQTHCIGAELKIVADIEDMIMASSSLASLGPLGGGIMGMTGTGTYCYGTNTSLNYIGPKGDIRRAPTASKTSDNRVGWKPGLKKDADDLTQPSPADATVAKAVTALSTVMFLAMVSTEMVLRFVYPKYNGKSQDYNRWAQLIKGLNCAVTSRLMGVIRGLELASSYTDIALHDAKRAKLIERDAAIQDLQRIAAALAQRASLAQGLTQAAASARAVRRAAAPAGPKLKQD
jgi:hypothetical protein